MKFLGFICIAFFLCGCWSQSLPKGSHELKFSSESWKDESSFDLDKENVTDRQKMLGDLVENYLPNKSRSEILKILGKPSTKMDPDGSGSGLSYPTGFQRDSYFAIDSEWLIIEFDSAELFKKYSLRSD